MSFLHEPLPDEQVLERYLLGLLADEETERLDQASIEDDDIAWRLRVAEDDLIDAYLRCTLAEDTQQRFETYYMSARLRRERVAFAATLLRAVDRAALRAGVDFGEDDENLPSGSESRADAPRSMFHSKLMAGLAAAAAVVVACGVLLLNSGRSGNRLPGADSQRAAIERPARTPEQPANESKAAGAATIERPEASLESGVPGRTRRLTPVPSGQVPPAQAAPTIALVLPPQTRAGGSVPTLALPAGDGRVAFELQLEPNDASRYEVGLKDPVANRVVWRSGWIARTQSGDEATLVVVIPARVLKPQHYSFDLNVRGPGGRSDVTGSYSFQVLPR
jgi:hypothetical protein